jgi:acetolactate synthase I/II/III large subunit
MGFGLPSALGAKIAAPNKTVIDIDGDSSFTMTAMELATASQFNIGVKVMVMNDGYQGMVTQWEGLYRLSSRCLYMFVNCIPTDMFYNGQHLYSHMLNPDFVQLARSMGVHAIQVGSANELPEKMKEFLEYDGNRPVLLDCIIASHQHLYPLVCSGSMINVVARH